MSANTGGPAFPRPKGWNGLPHAEEHQANDEQDGMSLRDYFAAKAMQGMVCGLVADEAKETLEQLAWDAFAVADAMLEERKKAIPLGCSERSQEARMEESDRKDEETSGTSEPASTEDTKPVDQGDGGGNTEPPAEKDPLAE